MIWGGAGGADCYSFSRPLSVCYLSEDEDEGGPEDACDLSVDDLIVRVVEDVGGLIEGEEEVERAESDEDDHEDSQVDCVEIREAEHDHRLKHQQLHVFLPGESRQGGEVSVVAVNNDLLVLSSAYFRLILLGE